MPKKRARIKQKPRKSKLRSEKQTSVEPSLGFPIVGIGASAGGLKAFEQFFVNLPLDLNAGFVLIPHLDPGHVSMLPDLLRKYTEMEVVQAEDRMRVKPGQVYVIPPNTDMVMMQGTLLFKEPSQPRGLRLPIDTFFRSLAEDQREKAIGIILSGNGTDGTLGLKAIKAELGMAMAQHPASAEYQSMPRSAVESGVVDYVLAPDKLAKQLATYLKHLAAWRAPMAVTAMTREPAGLQRIFQLLRSKTGHDFSLYKKNTLLRRIERRMSVHQIEKLEDYVSYLERNSHEMAVLFKEFLIGVTNFFRDPQAFDALGHCIVTKVLADKPKDYVLRAWIPGCASGEEAYSIAMVLRESVDAVKKNFKIQVFGTDIDSDAIEHARLGLYPASIVPDLSPERLQRFFSREGNAYRIKKEIREMVVFAVQDILKDPPFTKLDVLSCRNLLIYLDTELQRKLLPLFHYAIRPDGLLFLGTSEGIDGFTDLFSVIEKKWKLFQRRPITASADAVVHFPPAGVPIVERTRPEPAHPGKTMRETAVADLVQKLLLESYAPPCVFIDAEGKVVYTHGRTGKYLELAPGHVNLDVIEMAREGVKHELAAAIRKVRIQQRSVTLKGLKVKTNGGWHTITLTVKPVRGAESLGELAMVSFEDVPQKQLTVKTAKTALAPKAAERISQLERELRYTQEHLQTVIEELETSNEEMKSSNEELQSTNEELQSTNEELETSKEELQSLNEELVTVNAELQGKIEELSRTNDDMKNLLDSTKIAAVFLDNQLRIKRFTPEATQIVNLISSDLGRPLGHIVNNLEHDTLRDDAQSVIDTLVPHEKTSKTTDGRWYLNRIVPYRTLENVIDGVVMTFTDISEQKAAEAAIREASLLAGGIVETVPEPLLALDTNFKVLAANSAYCRLFQVTPETTVNQSFFTLGEGQWDIPQLREGLAERLSADAKTANFVVDHDFSNIGRRKMTITARRIRLLDVGQESILLVIKAVSATEKVKNGI